MGKGVANVGQDRWVRRLYLPAYGVGEAAMLAQTHPRTVSRWFYGYRTPSGARADRVLGDRERRVALSYLQLVEVAFVATLRRIGVTLQRLRIAHEYLAHRFGAAEYPFAQLKLKTDGAHVLKDLETESSWVNSLLVASAHGQIVWADPIEERIRQFDYDLEHGLAIRWYPRGPDAPVVVDPQIAFGAPILRDDGIPTGVIRGRYQAGEDPGEIGEDFGIRPEAVRYALEFEGVQFVAAMV
jgi:uncharacterized protein (DUF433 family)